MKEHEALNIKKIMSLLENLPSQRMIRKDLSHLRKARLIE
jgi:hypothetical protein